jgi:hypothetical protein
MPRYYFHLLEESNQTLVRDLDGIILSDDAEATKEAIGLAQDIVGHGIHKSRWQVVVTNANADIILATTLSEIRPRKMKAWLALVRRISMYEPKIRSHIFTWLLTVATFVMIVQAALLTRVSRDAERVALSHPSGAVNLIGDYSRFADEAPPYLTPRRSYFWRHGAAPTKNP